VAEERWWIFEVREVDWVDAWCFGFHCFVKGCRFPAYYLVTLTNGERGKYVQLCPRHFRELQKHLPISTPELDLFLNHNLIEGCRVRLWD